MVDQLDIPKERLGESAGRVLSRSIEEARRRDHAVLTSEHVCAYSTYASAKPTWATNIIRYMCAHETWFASTASSSGRRSIR